MRNFRGLISVVLTITLAVFLSGCCDKPEEASSQKSVMGDAIAGEHRTEKNRARDGFRHPSETLSFFGLQPDMTVVELWPGGGWYSEILAPALREEGKLIAASFGSDFPVKGLVAVHEDYVQKLADDPAVYDKVEVIAFSFPDHADLGEEGSVDMVVTFRNTHNWIKAGIERDVYAAAFKVLKPGGVFGVVQHRGKDDWNAKQSAWNGYVPEPYVIEMAESTGFKLVGSSEINANSKDVKAYPKGVWTLPPTYRMKEVDKEKWTTIGESDRMTLKFVKPE